MSGATGYSSGSTGTGNKIAGYQQGQLQQFTPEQIDLFKNLFGYLGPDSQTAKLARGDQGAFNEIEAPALQQLGQFQSGLASRFSQGSGEKGALSARRSSGHQLAQGQLASDFAAQLASRRQSLQREALGDLFGLSNQLLGQRPYENFLIDEEDKQPWWKSLIAGGLPIAGAAAGGFFGGLPGAQAGGQIGAAAGKAFL